MLNRLYIKNIALIEEEEIEFTSGLNILSGETGSGKSVILDSLNFVLGAKADKTMIRRGQDYCQVTAVFTVNNNSKITQLFKEEDIDFDDEIIISRKYTLTGSSNIKVNGEPVSVSTLKKITSLLVDVHGQSEHFYLLKESNQLELIDKFANDKISTIKTEIYNLVKELKEVNNSLSSFGGDDKQRAIKLDILNFQIKEIEDASLQDGELEELYDLKNKLNNQERICEALSIVKQALSNEGAGIDAVSVAKGGISQISNISEEYSNLFTRLDALYDEITDIADTVGDLIDNSDFNEFDLNRVEERLSVIKNLLKKYGPNYEDVTMFLDNALKERDVLENYDVLTEKLTKKQQTLKNTIFSLYQKLSKERKSSAEEFSNNVVNEIRELKMKNAQFSVNFSPLNNDTDCLSTNGIDNIEFLFSANLGEPLKPLSKIISGGEMSRFMLAIKAQTAKYNEVSTFLFDEIDAGISGETASLVGEKFIKLSKDVQLIAISHLPQIVALGDNNLQIEKIETGDKTVTKIHKIDNDLLVNEIIRLIGGDKNDETAVLHAKSLLNNANLIKNKYN
jgi:DNA repair protein RecN (Recombination protein N)